MGNEAWKQDLEEFKSVTRQFYKKEVAVKDYKGFSGGFGSYAQRGAEASMLRLRLSGGRMTKEQLAFIADSIEKYQVDKVHFTTCQSVQLHNLSGEAVCEIMEAALDAGINTRGGGGDFPRNVMVSPLSGVEKGEWFDVLPYALKAADYLMGFIKTVKLPRKLKVCFSNSPKNLPHATFRDLGFAAREDGRFDVYSAGGLGANPRMGALVAEGAAPEDILYYIKAMVKTFVAYGDYKNRGKARTRYMQASLGTEGYIRAYQEKLSEVMEEEKDGLKLRPEEISALGLDKEALERKAEAGRKALEELSGEEKEALFGRRVTAQKQEGLFAVEFHPVAGTPDPSVFRNLYETVKEMDCVEMRVAPDEAMYIVNLTAGEALQVLKVTKDSAQNLFETSVACIGASVCQVGVRDSQKLMQTLVEEMRKRGFKDGALPRIHISGCPSSCGTHQIGTIGFQGGVKVIDKAPNPAFVLHVNGRDSQGSEQFGENWGMMLEKDIPTFLAEVGETVEKSGKSFDEWFAKNLEGLKEIAGKYLC